MDRSAIHPSNIMTLSYIDGPITMNWSSKNERTQPIGKPSSPATDAKRSERHPLFGALKDVTFIPPGIDLTEAADPNWGEVYEKTAVVPAKPSTGRDP